MADPIDHTDFLVKIHEVQDLAQVMLTRLHENADTEAKLATYERIKEVVNLQSYIIKELVEENIRHTDVLEQLLRTIETKQ